MKQILPPDPLVRRILGSQKRRADAAYRPLRYCHQLKMPEGTLLYNGMTKELLLLNPEEAEEMTDSDALLSRWFLAPEGQDDRALADQLRAVALALRPQSKAITSYTIFTTTDCNARCFYCYELGARRVDMAEDTARRVAAYIAAHCGGKKVNLHWFGGEPLVNAKAIDIICESLRKAGVAYTSTMVSNGYLFEPETVEKAAEIWKLRWVQITLDGTEEMYNRCKAYPMAKESPFRRVLRNIGLLQKARIRVIIRLNMGTHNGEDLILLTDELARRFGSRPGVTVYTRPLYDLSQEELREANSNVRTLRAHVDSLYPGMSLFECNTLTRNMSLNACMADSYSAVTILPGGELGRCEHFLESEFFGHIDSDARDEAVLQNWRERNLLPECSECPLYASCYQLKKCPDAKSVCSPERQKTIKENLLLEMRNTYHAYLRHGTANTNDEGKGECL